MHQPPAANAQITSSNSATACYFDSDKVKIGRNAGPTRPQETTWDQAHFGPKLHEQHIAMGASILALGHEQGVALPALERLMLQIESRPSPA